jgi:hypothetical protein
MTERGPVPMLVQGSSLTTNAEMIRLVQASFPGWQNVISSGRANDSAGSDALVIIWHVSPRFGRHPQTFIRLELIERGVAIRSVYGISGELDRLSRTEATHVLTGLMARLTEGART